MEMTPDIAFSSAQILAVLLVATMFDPWSKGAAGTKGTPRPWLVSAFVSYFAKVLALVVLLFDMQLVLFDSTWSGGRATVLVLGNYVALVAASLSILLAVPSHICGLGRSPAGAAATAEDDPE